MPTPTSPKAIFDGLIQHPLPPKAGVKDYIFYFVPDVRFGAGARSFFTDARYPNHARFEVSTLEQLITSLHNHIAAHHITQVREIVIVAHANILGMRIPIVPAAEDSRPEYKFLTPQSLVMLQKDFEAGKFHTFKQQRSDVVKCLKHDSWVTLRACNIGNSTKCLYALFSFFGGQPNVYGSKKYHFFGPCPVMAGSRMVTREDVYQYLVRQHFLTTNEHAPKRRDTIVDSLLDPGDFSLAFPLASTQTDPTATYQAIRGQLNKHQTGASAPELWARFSANGHALSGGAYFKTIPGDSDWLIIDRIDHAGTAYDVHYEISEVDFNSAGKPSIMASARIMLESAQDSVPIQLFFDDPDHDAFMGKLFTLAGYADGGAESGPVLEQEFTAIKSLLDQGNFSDGTVDIKGKFAALPQNIELSAVHITTLSSGPAAKWRIDDGDQSFLVNLEQPLSHDGYNAHALSVYKNLSDAALKTNQARVFMSMGEVPDMPGTELAAYLDQFTTDELASFVDYLRAPYRGSHAYFIKHAIRAMERKRDYLVWYRAHVDQNVVLSQGPDFIRPNEWDDLALTSFPFEFNPTWNEVKAGSPYVSDFVGDLFSFAVEDLGKKIKPDVGPDDIPDDSPYVSRDELRQYQSQGVQNYYANTSKSMLGPARVDIDCKEFGDALYKWKELKAEGKQPEEIEAALEDLKAADNESYFEKLKKAYEQMGMAKEFTEIVFGKEVWKDVFGREFKTLDEYLLEKFAERFTWAAEGVELWGEYGAVFTIPWELWKQVLEAQQEAVEKSEAMGKIVAIRQWLQEVILLTYQQPFRKYPSIDLGGPNAYWQRYLDELRLEYTNVDPSRAVLGVYSPDDMKKGFSEGAELMERVGPEILEKAEEAASEAIGKLNVDPCKVNHLIAAGLLDLDKVRALLIRQVVDALRDKVPRV